VKKKPAPPSPPRKPPFGIRFDDDEKDALKKAGAAEDRSASYIVRRVVREWLTAKGFLK
jgi:predicted transcriptional regulator